MKAHDAEKLLGGYAAGILTEAEKTRLFEAALDHQEVFDALADEEALRELLADPSARRHLLGLLAEPEPQRVRPFWRRPAMLGVAASLFLLVTTSVVLVRREAPALASRATEAPQVPVADAPPASPKAEPAANSRTDFSAAPRVESQPKAMAKKSEAPPAEALAAPTREAEAKASIGYLPPPAPSDAFSAAPKAKLAKQAPAPNSASTAEIVAAQPTLDRAKAETSSNVSQEQLERLPVLSRTTEGAALLAPGVAAGMAAPAPSPAGKGQSAPPPITWALENRESGRPVLVVTHPTEGHLYLLKRTDSKTLLLVPQDTRPLAGNLRQSTFRFDAGASDHVDLYLMHHPEPDPRALPEHGALKGYRARIF